MGPAADQSRTLVSKRSKFDLHAAFARAGAGAEDLENQSGPVDYLGLPGTLKIALLNRRNSGIDDDKPDFLGFDQYCVPVDDTLSKEGGWANPPQPDRFRVNDVEVDRLSKPHCFVQPRHRIPGDSAIRDNGVQDQRAAGAD